MPIAIVARSDACSADCGSRAISAASAEHGLRYSLFMNGLKKAGVELDRKSLSELAIHDPAGFKAIVDQAKQALAV